MQKIVLWLLGLCGFLPVIHSQPPPKQAPRTYAVVVGISSYSREITSLDFAHRDAEEFARFLQSAAGGNVPADQIRLLLNEQATYTAIYNALYWLLEVCQPDDKVYFYFSGHGDVENSTIYKLGFLLAANTPRFNYINNAIRVEDLNNIANTLSAERRARVILITDACRSGKLAGQENRGSFLIGDQLRAVLGNEVRITSCGPDELSNEDVAWAGGRGVFSYYLVKGLEGLADESGDQMVTLNEIKSYMQSALANDRVLKEKEHPQHPIVSGADTIVMTRVSPVSIKTLVSADQQPLPAPVMPTLGVSPQGYVLGLMKGKVAEKVFDFWALGEMNVDQIPFACIEMITRSLDKKAEPDTVKINRLIRSLRENKDALKRFREKLVEIMADRGQEIINLYLEGDESEIEKRRYYSNISNQYAVYPQMLRVALKMVDPENQLHQILKVKYHYFSGVTFRMKLPMVSNGRSLIDSALKEQLQALALEKNAAYIYNELGILYRYKSQLPVAENYYLQATRLAPAWALPYSNLAGLYAASGQLDKALEMADKAQGLLPGLQSPMVNKGVIQEKKGNLLLAEEFYMKSIRLNSRHYFPFERMGYVHMQTTRYASADSNFVEAEKRKKGFLFTPFDVLSEGVVDAFDVYPPPFPCYYDTSKIATGDIIGQFYIGLKYLENKQRQKAEWKFKQVIRLDPAHPLAYHQLGKMMYEEQRWKEGDLYFRSAIRYHLSKEKFARYCDSLIRIYPQYDKQWNSDSMINSAVCAYTLFEFSWQDKKIDRYFLASLSEKWQHYIAAEEQYRAILKEDPFETAACIRAVNLMEKLGRFQDAENLIMAYPVKEFREAELPALYARITKAHPYAAEWFYKAGVFLYDLYQASPEKYSNDHKTLMADGGKANYTEKFQYSEQEFKEYKVPGTGAGFIKPISRQMSAEEKADNYQSGEMYFLYEPIEFPLTEAINYFLTAASLIPEWNRFTEKNGNVVLTDNHARLSEIGLKTGDLYVWQGLPQLAEQHYRRSIDMLPDDAVIRLKYIYSAISNYQYSKALSQLDTIYNKGQINIEAQMLMALYCIHAGRFEEGRKLLREAETIHPLPVEAIPDLLGRLEWLSNQPLKAIPYYKTWLSNHPGDHAAMYTLARIYARTGNSTEAWKWLGKSLDNGFNYYYVLQNDESWNKFRSTAKWKTLTAKVKVPVL